MQATYYNVINEYNSYNSDFSCIFWEKSSRRRNGGITHLKPNLTYSS